MNDFDIENAYIEALVNRGRYPSKGEARRALEAGEIQIPEWFMSVGRGLSGVTPAMPNIANRDVAFAGQNAGAGVLGILEVTRPRSRWQRFLALFRRKWSPFGKDGRLRPNLAAEGWTHLGTMRDGDA